MRKWNKLLSLLLAMVMALGMTVSAMADEDTSGDADGAPAAAFEVPAEADGAIVILHTNDVHGAIEGYAKVAALEALYEEAGAYVLVMDAGDFSQGETSVSASQGAVAIELMNMAGYDAAAPGNHEFDYGYENLTKLAGAAQFPILAANITYNGELAFGDNVVFETEDGVKLGVFGLDTPEAKTKSHPGKTVGVEFAASEDMYAVAQAQVDELPKAGCDYIICLGHLGIDDETAAAANRSIDLLEKVTGIDVFIDGHSHSTLDQIAEKTNENRTVGGTVVTSTGTKLANIGVVMIKDGEITTDNISSEVIAAAEDSEITARAAAIRAEIEKEYGAAFAASEVLLNGDKAPGNRTEETNLGDLITDAILWYATKDGEDMGVAKENVVALTNGGGIRAPIAIGDISKNDVNTVLPFGNTVAYITIKGEALLEALEASTYTTPDAVGGFPQVAGISFTIDTTKTYDQGDLYPGSTYYAPKSINRVTIDSVNGQDFDPEATYVVVTNDFTAAGGDTYYAFSVATVVDTGTPMDEALMAYITEVLEGTVPADKYAEPAGRITVVTEAAEPAEPEGPAEPDAKPDEPAAAVTFSDVTEANWHYAFVTAMVNDGIVTGYPDGTFKPGDSVNWGAALKMVLAYALKIEASEKESTFPDTDDGYVLALAELGVIGGNPDGTFNPNGELTRAQLCKILAEAPEAPAAEAPAEGEDAADTEPAGGEDAADPEPTEGEADTEPTEADSTEPTEADSKDAPKAA